VFSYKGILALHNLANTIELVHSFAHSTPQPKRQIDRFSRFAQLTAESTYTLQWACLRFVTAAMSLMELNQTLHDVWPSPGLVHYVYIFGGSCPLPEFCQVQNSLCVQVLRSPTLAALLHGTRTVGVSQTFRRGRRNRITEFSLLVIFNRGRHLHSESGHYVGHRATF